MTDSYAIDSSSLVIVNREMPRDIHVSLWEAIDELVNEQRLFMPREVHEELSRVDDGLASWAKGFTGFIVEPTDAEVATVAEIGGQYPGWVSDRQNAADPWLIAHCKEFDRRLVTQERPKGPGALPANMKIPNVAQAHKVVCHDFNQLARDLGWTF